MDRDALIELENVIGSGLGADALEVYVSKKAPKVTLAPRDRIPKKIEGLPTRVVETGRFRSLASPLASPQAQLAGMRDEANVQHVLPSRPARPGDSISHLEGSTATLGAVVSDANGERYFLGCSHALALPGGDRILSPTRHDIRYQWFSPVPQPRTIGYLHEVFPLRDEAQPMPSPPSTYYEVLPDGRLANLVDAALVKPVFDHFVSPDPVPSVRLQRYRSSFAGRRFPYDEFGSGLGPPTDTMLNPRPGDPVQLMSAWYRWGVITAVDVEMSYEIDGLTYRFRHQLMSDIPGHPGDSGALLTGDWLSPNERLAYGQLFAGSQEHSVYTPMDTLLRLFNVSLVS